MIEISDIYTNPKAKLFAAFMPMPNEELIGNALIINEHAKNFFTSIIGKEFEVQAIEKRTGEEEITPDILTESEEKLQNLDERGIIKVGTKVKKGDILVGKLSPKEDREISHEDKLLRAIFGEKTADTMDTSLRMPYGDEAIVIDTKYFSRKEKKDLPYLVSRTTDITSRVIYELARVYIAIKKDLQAGDILKDTNGNKGVIVKIDNIPLHISGHRDEKIDVIGGLSSSFITNLENCETKSAWSVKKWPYLRLYSKKVKNSKQIAYMKEKYEEFEEEAKKYKYLGEAKIGYLTLERLTTLIEEKITARSTGLYFLISQKPNLNDITGHLKGAMIGEKGLSILKEYPSLFKEALTIRSNSVKERVKAYGELTKNGKF